jgi:NADH:ubiquinone reductase (non-electrogenic)
MCLPASFPAFLPVQVSKDSISLSTGEVLKYGVCVWSAGNAPRPLVQQLATQIPQQVRHLAGCCCCCGR